MRLMAMTLIALIAACSPGAVDVTPAPSPAEIGVLVSQELVGRDDFAMYRVDDVEAVHYAEAAALYGAAKLAGLTGDQAMIDALAARHQRVIDEALPNTANHVDANVYGVAPLELYRQTGRKAYLEQGLALADGQWAAPLPDGLTSQTRYWIDDVWMIGVLQVEAYRATGDRVYLDRAAITAAAYIARLQQPNGLFHHGPEAPFFWGRGNGWVAAGLAEILLALPGDHPHYPAIRSGYEKMMAALLAHQAESGMWRQLIDYPDAWEESSSTAMFAFAFVVGVKAGILSDAQYKEGYEKAWKALAARIDTEGRLRGVCVGTGQSRDAQYYLDRPSVEGDLHGQAPVLWLAAAMLE